MSYVDAANGAVLSGVKVDVDTAEQKINRRQAALPKIGAQIMGRVVGKVWRGLHDCELLQREGIKT